MKLEKNARIVIIGAGPSGIAAAAKLFENGLANVTILEAQNRIGGRIYTTKLGEYDIDLGAQWMQGVLGNPIYELAHPHGLLELSDGNFQDRFNNTYYFDSHGDSLSDEVLENFNEFYWTSLGEQPYGLDTSETSTGSCLVKMFEEKFKNKPEMMASKKKLLEILERGVVGVDPAECWFNISSTHLFKFYEGEQLANWKDRTFSMVLDVLMKRYPNPELELPIMNNTKLNSEVVSIDYARKENSEPVVIKTVGGQVFKADHVIVTIPLGVLKEKHSTMFNPPLPMNKTKAIEDFGFGNVAKIFLLFDKPFWKKVGEEIYVFIFSWNEDDIKSIKNDTEKSWLLGLYRAHSVEHKPNLLELWVSGRYAKEMELLPEETVLKHCVESLYRFLGKRYNITMPKDMLRTQWFTNPHFRGTYSYRSVKTQKLGIDSDEVEEPINSKELTILFAGEATSKHRYATVDGAIESGWKAADRLINFYSPCVI